MYASHEGLPYRMTCRVIGGLFDPSVFFFSGVITAIRCQASSSRDLDVSLLTPASSSDSSTQHSSSSPPTPPARRPADPPPADGPPP
jgi:hypothetical protein